MRRGDVWRQPLSIGIGSAHDFSDCVPIICQQRVAHLLSRVANAFEDLEHFGVAVDMTLEHFPVVDSRHARLAGVANHKAAIDFVFFNGQMLALDSVRSQMNAGSRAVERRIIILNARGNFDDGRFDVGGNTDKAAFIISITGQTVQRADQSDRQRGRS